jgi:predicted nuclease of restriction endonuclease-like (RecB) superfamily
LRYERALEQTLVDHIQSFLLELGTGFAFVGRQVHLQAGDRDFYIDLLFYHVRLHCYVVEPLHPVDRHLSLLAWRVHPSGERADVGLPVS